MTEIPVGFIDIQHKAKDLFVEAFKLPPPVLHFCKESFAVSQLLEMLNMYKAQWVAVRCRQCSGLLFWVDPLTGYCSMATRFTLVTGAFWAHSHGGGSLAYDLKFSLFYWSMYNIKRFQWQLFSNTCETPARIKVISSLVISALRIIWIQGAPVFGWTRHSRCDVADPVFWFSWEGTVTLSKSWYWRWICHEIETFHSHEELGCNSVMDMDLHASGAGLDGDIFTAERICVIYSLWLFCSSSFPVQCLPTFCFEKSSLQWTTDLFGFAKEKMKLPRTGKAAWDFSSESRPASGTGIQNSGSVLPSEFPTFLADSRMNLIKRMHFLFIPCWHILSKTICEN